MIYCGWDCKRFFPDEILIQGHGDAGIGRDLVCASVSTACYSCLTYLMQHHNPNIKIKTGKGLCHIVSKDYLSDEEVRVLIRLVSTLKMIEREYPNQVHVYKIMK